ncbi:hypothetical protein A5696_02840 [Mycobacterium sp. E2699]|uniref:hypothetical protein n=1 Tax=Mycobacterium sp. E2699 TaxID=1834137 RepID=UPI00080139A3|nr:hypothetical protein [Mycobacterium sp. E2699]OBH05102.1 hypothetical protein A5696_02840 [Mycobacterium sp. E2699]
MGMLLSFAPWIVYWVLVGNVPFAAAALIALAIAVAVIVVGATAGNRWEPFEMGSAAVLSVLAILTYALGDSFTQRWILPLGNAGIFAVALLGALIGKPFARRFAAAEQPDDVVKTEPFARMVGVLTWTWIVAFAGMTVSSAIPPIVDRNAAIVDATPLSYVCYWIIPFSLWGLAALASRVLTDRMLVGIEDVARETSFVAYDEATIDELYYLAQEHANREVGPGKEAYDVKVGGMGTPLTGDESRKSWPSTYKVRDKRR